VNCAEFKDNVAALAIGALEPAERAACEEHLARPGAHDGCHDELGRAMETATLLAASLPPVRPSPDLWLRIESAIAEPTGEASHAIDGKRTATASRAAAAPGRESPDRASRRPAWREVIAWNLAAAAAAVAFVMGVERRHADRALGEAEHELARVENVDLQRQQCLNELASARIALRQKAAAISLIGDPRTQLVQLAPQGGAPYRASAIVNSDVPNAMVLASSLTPQEGKDYQLWLIRGNEKISAGLLHADPTGATIAAVPRDVLAGGRPDAFAITIEPAGGAPQPTGPIVLVGALPKT